MAVQETEYRVAASCWRGSWGLPSAVPGANRSAVHSPASLAGQSPASDLCPPASLRAGLAVSGVTVNALVIETDPDIDLTAYFWENVITGEGAFVVTANGFADYPRRIRQKLIRETTRKLAAIPR